MDVHIELIDYEYLNNSCEPSSKDGYVESTLKIVERFRASRFPELMWSGTVELFARVLYSTRLS